MYALNYFTSENRTGLNIPPKPHAFTSLPLQSSILKIFPSKIDLACFTFSTLISLLLSIGLFLGYKLPIWFVLGHLNLPFYYTFLDIIITICGLIMTINIKKNHGNIYECMFQYF